MNAVNWFELPVRDLQRATDFYAKVLGRPLKVETFGSETLTRFGSAKDGAGGALVQEAGREPSEHGARIYMPIADITAALQRASEAGGKVVSEKTSIGPMGFTGLFRDLDGNVVGLHAYE
ncbi:MAG: VOC family protein [Polyangiales bacterium]